MTDEPRCAEAPQVALQLGELGYHCFPCSEHKKPTIRANLRRATRFPRQLRTLWATRPGPLVGVVTGQKSDLLVLDVDSVKHPAAAAWLEKHQQLLAPFRRHTTRSGGCHYVFKHHHGLRTRRNIAIEGRKVEGLDLSADGGYVIWWPGTGLPVTNDAVAPLPDWLLLDLMRGVKNKAAEQAAEHYTSILPGLLASRAYRALSPAAKQTHLFAEARFRPLGFTMPSREIVDALQIGSSTVSAAMRELRALTILTKVREEKRPGHPDAPPGKGLAALYQLPHRLRGARLEIGEVPWRTQGDPWFKGYWRINTKWLLLLQRHAGLLPVQWTPR